MRMVAGSMPGPVPVRTIAPVVRSDETATDVAPIGVSDMVVTPFCLPEAAGSLLAAGRPVVSVETRRISVAGFLLPAALPGFIGRLQAVRIQRVMRREVRPGEPREINTWFHLLVPRFLTATVDRPARLGKETA